LRNQGKNTLAKAKQAYYLVEVKQLAEFGEDILNVLKTVTQPTDF